MKKQKVYILLTDTGTLFTKMIKLYTKKPYNHASIAFGRNLMEAYSFGRKNPRNPFKGGFVREDIQGHLFQQARCSVYCCTVTDDELQKMNDYVDEMEAKKDLYRYNLIGLFAVIFNKPLERRNAFFCSQFVATVLLECNVVAFEKPLSLITPHDLQASPEFELVYQGSVAGFYTGTEMELMNAI